MELSPVDNYPRGTGPAFPERFRYEPVTFNCTSLSMHFAPLETGEWAPADHARPLIRQRLGANEVRKWMLCLVILFISARR